VLRQQILQGQRGEENAASCVLGYEAAGAEEVSR
jgi:hypothetical protein